ncbi:hypothetical protein ACHQM5_000019 [Ranunculus cassubicifolius]
MRGRSHRLPMTDSPDVWENVSWTVDCVCGVNFDDGEEMVDCDDCKVWMHTRCSRFKGGDSFTCHKCIIRNHHINKEEEVAQLLVDLPTKTLTPSTHLRLWTEIPIHEKAHVHGVPGGDPALFRGISSVFTPELWKCSGYVPKKFNFQYREFPCWDDTPKPEENDNPVDRGADALFLLSKEIVSANPVDMLVGLRGSVENASRDRDKSRKEGKRREPYDSNDKYVHNGVQRETNHIRSPNHLGKRKKENIRTDDLLTGKKKARSASKIVDGKRRVSVTGVGTQIESHRVGESKAPEKDFQNSVKVNKTSLDHTPDSCLDANKSKTKGNFANYSHYAEDSMKRTKSKDSVAAAAYHAEDSLQKAKPRDNIAVIGEDSSKKVKPRAGLEVNNHHANDLFRKGKSKDKSLIKSHHIEDISKKVKTRDNLKTSAYRGEDSKEAWKNSSLVEIVVKSESGHQAPTRTGSSSETVSIEVSLLEPNGISPVKDYQGLNKSVGSLDCPNDVKHERRDVYRKSSTTALSSPKLKPSVGQLSNVAPAVLDTQALQDSNNSILPSSLKSSMKVKTEASGDHPTGNSSALSSPTIDAKLDSLKQLKISVPEDEHENNQVHETHTGSVLTDEAAVTELKTVSCAVKNNGIEGTIPISGEPCENKEVIGSAGTLSVQESSESKNLKNVEEPSKTEAVNPSPASPLSQRRVVKSSSSTTVLISKSEVSGSCKPPGRPASPSTLRPIHFTKRVKANSNLCADVKKDHTAADAAKDEFKQEEPKKAAREQLKSPAVSASKLSHMSRVSHASISKHNISDSKESVLCPSPKPPVAQNVTVTSSSIEAARSVSPAQNKTSALSSSERGERSNQSGSQQSPKVVSYSSSMHPPPPFKSSSTLSDEELALLLHQELNSSPRVPRVPRIRHASSIPQAPPTPASMLIKRTSGSGVKDHHSVLRRKNKEEVSKDGYRNSSREHIDETKKSSGSISSSHGLRKQDQAVTSDACAKKEAVDISPDTAKRNAPASTTITSGHSEATEQSSLRNSPGNTSDDDYNDDTGGVAGPATRTLPGLLDEIMGKGKRMTYEELCNAVLPHWNNLRKHNGERYAYSSHSQAVLDCLRNRNEWAQLVDRGPKTTAGRKKRKVEEEEAEEDGEYHHHYRKSRSIGSNVVESAAMGTVEDFPKGKRKARKRRRLALQGRGIRDVRKNKRQQHKTSSAAVSEDDDDDSSPESSDDGGSIFSEDSQGVVSRTTTVATTSHPATAMASEASSSMEEEAGSL